MVEKNTNSEVQAFTWQQQQQQRFARTFVRRKKRESLSNNVGGDLNRQWIKPFAIQTATSTKPILPAKHMVGNAVQNTSQQCQCRLTLLGGKSPSPGGSLENNSFTSSDGYLQTRIPKLQCCCCSGIEKQNRKILRDTKGGVDRQAQFASAHDYIHVVVPNTQ